MQAIITKTTTIDFDLDKERDRIKRIFKKKKEKIYRDALLGVIDAFEKDGLLAAYAAYDALPYNEIDEYPLQESMGLWWWNINGEMLYSEGAKVTITKEIEIKH